MTINPQQLLIAYLYSIKDKAEKIDYNESKKTAVIIFKDGTKEIIIHG